MKALLRNWLFSWSTILLISSFILIPLSASASDITDAIYVGTVRVHNDNTTATVVSTNMSLSTQNLIDHGYMAENATNTALYTHLGVDTAYMPSVNSTVPWSLFVPSIAGYTQLDYKLYMGGTTDMGSKLAYFPGATGMTAVDNATIELGDNFTIEQYGYIDSAVSANLTAKASAIQVSTGSGNITATISGGPTVTGNVTAGEHTWNLTGVLSAGAAGWLTDYDYRKEFTIAGTTAGAQTNYQMQAELHSWLAWEDQTGINPIVSPTQAWEGDNIYSLSVLTDAEGTAITESGNYRGYWGGFVLGTGDQIGTGTSADGLSWTKYASNPILTKGAAGTWESLHVNDPSVVKVGSTYYLFYSGLRTTDPIYGGQIGLATAANPQGPFTKSASNPVITENYTATDYYPRTPTVIYEDGLFKMWYSSFTSTGAFALVYYATSTNGTTWTRHGAVSNVGGNSGNPEVKRLDDNTLILATDDSSDMYLWASANETAWYQIDYAMFPPATAFGQNGPGLLRTATGWNLYYGQSTTADDLHNRIAVAQSGDHVISTSDIPHAEMGLNLHVQSDFDDIRFTSDNGSGLLDYYIETQTDNQTATVWVELGSVPASPASGTYYVYYGNTTASSSSNGTNTFMIFDDFERGNSGDAIGGIWTVLLGTAQISTDHAAGGTRSAKMSTATAVSTPLVASTQTYEIRAELWKENLTGTIYAILHGNATHRADFQIDNLENIYNAGVDTTKNSVADTWRFWKVNDLNFTGNTVDVYEENVVVQNNGTLEVSGGANNILEYYNSDAVAGHDFYIDQVVVRNWRSVEPAWSTWGDEEPMGSGGGGEESGLALYINGTLADLEPWSGSGVTDNGNTWTFVEAAAMPYMYYHKIWIGDVLKQHIEWEYDDTTFTDLSGYGQDTTPSFRTSSSDADVWAELLNFGPIDLAESPGAGTSDPPAIVDTPTQPGGMYTELSVTLPGATMINAILDGASIPRALFWFPMFMLFILLISFATHWGTRSTVMKAVVLWLCFMFVAALGGWGWWILIPFAIELWAAVIAMKKIGW